MTAFYTLQASRALQAAGVDRAQAEEHAAQLKAAADADRSEAATKIDLATLETRLTWRMVIISGLWSGVLFALLRFVPAT